jgi:hypothetical protein
MRVFMFIAQDNLKVLHRIVVYRLNNKLPIVIEPGESKNKKRRT